MLYNVFRDASNHRDLAQVFHSLVTEGVRVTLHVEQSFKRPTDDDDSDDDDEVAIWTEVGDCGIPFQQGETYLVYADGDEETGRLQTSRCYRTQRLTEAGERPGVSLFLPTKPKGKSYRRFRYRKCQARLAG
jgi:hypothetical protein